MRVESDSGIARFTGGKEGSITIDVRKADGEVKITSVTDDTISGEINITEGQHKVKGRSRRRSPLSEIKAIRDEKKPRRSFAGAFLIATLSVISI